MPVLVIHGFYIWSYAWACSIVTCMSLLHNLSYKNIIYFNVRSQMTTDLQGLFFSWFITFVIRLHDIKYLHYQFGLILHTGPTVHMTKVCLNRVVPYFQPSSYLATVQTFKQQLEYLRLTVGESVTHLHMNPFFLADKHSNIMVILPIFVTFIHYGFTNCSSHC